jgi:hypothetical protein
MGTHTRKRSSGFIHAAVAVLLSVFLVGSGAVAANAVPEGTKPAAVLAILPDRDASDAVSSGQGGSDSISIPLNRWGDELTNLHFRPNINDPLNMAAMNVKANTMSLMLSAVSIPWAGTATLSDLAVNLDPINVIGIHIDRSTASLGGVILSNPLIFILAALGLLFGALWNKSRGRDSTGLVKRALGVVLVMIAIGSMATGAASSKMVEDLYVPGVASPGWLLTTLTGVVGDATNGALSGVGGMDFSVAPDAEGSSTAMSCTTYVKNMNAQFNTTKQLTATSRQAMSSMWETSALNAWIGSQFGTENRYAEYAWCHRADALGGIGTIMQMDRTTDGVAGGAALRAAGSYDSKAWGGDDNWEDDKTVFAWAACEWNGSSWTVRPSFRDSNAEGDGVWITNSDCANWWSGGMTPAERQGTSQEERKAAAAESLTPFNVGTGEFGVFRASEHTGDPEVNEFARMWQGTDLGYNTTTIIFWSSLSSIILFLVLGLGLSSVIAGAKIMSAIMIMLMVLILIASLFTKEGPGQKVAGMTKQVIGYTILAAGGSALFLVITWMTQLLISLGNAIPGGSVGPLIWTALAPILALITVHLIFKKVFKTASPLTAKGALAWGAAGGAAGAAIGGGIASRVANRGKQAVTRSLGGMEDKFLNKVSGGKLGRPSGAGDRRGAGAPPIADNPRATAASTKAAAASHLDAARAHARGDVGMPTGAATSAKGANLGADGKPLKATTVSALLTGAGKNVAGGVASGARDLGTTAKFLTKSMGSKEGRAVIRQTGADAARNAASTAGLGIKRAAVNTKQAAGTALRNGFEEVATRSTAAINAKGARFAANPVAESWKTAKTVGKVGAVGLGSIVTGYTILPFVAGHYIKKGVTEKKRVDRAVDAQKLEQYENHLAGQAAEKQATAQHQHDVNVADEANRRAEDRNREFVVDGTGTAGRGGEAPPKFV